MGQMANSMGGGTNVADPGQSWGNMDSSQRGAQLLGGAAKGLGPGIQNYQQQNQALRQPQGGGMAPMPGAQPVDPSYFQPQRRGPNNLNFYGGQ